MVTKILSNGQKEFGITEEVRLDIDMKKWVGNSLEVNDTSVFRKTSGDGHDDGDLRRWWENQREFKKPLLLKIIKTAIELERLREVARWLTVKNISEVRKWTGVEKEKTKNGTITFRDKTEMKAVIQGIGVSTGKATGVIGDSDGIYQTPDKMKILFTEVLAPELTDNLGKVVGVIATHGGMLSHMAIVAREMGVPVVVNIKREDVGCGQKAEIDGESGIVRKV